MKYALIITGVLAGLAITAPQLVVFGYFLLIVPGLVLTVAPTVFIYLAVTAVIRRLLPISSPMKATVVAFGVTLLLGWAVMQPFRLAALAAYRADELPDVLSSQVIKLDGHVRIERPDQSREPECDYLVLAVLDSTRVKSLTTVTAGRRKPSDTLHSAAYALVSAKTDPAAGIFPSEPGRIVREYPPLVQANRGMRVITASKAVEANWAVRLAGDERLREVNAIKAEVADWVIRIDSQSNYRTSILQRVTILDSKGTVRFRKSNESRPYQPACSTSDFKRPWQAAQSQRHFMLGVSSWSLASVRWSRNPRCCKRLSSMSRLVTQRHWNCCETKPCKHLMTQWQRPPNLIWHVATSDCFSLTRKHGNMR